MKKLILCLSIFFIMTTSCKRKSSCMCKDADGKIARYTAIEDTPSEIKKFESECKKTRVSSQKNGTTVYTDCVVE